MGGWWVGVVEWSGAVPCLMKTRTQPEEWLGNITNAVKVFKVVKNSCNVVVILDDGAGAHPPNQAPPPLVVSQPPPCLYINNNYYH